MTHVPVPAPSRAPASATPPPGAPPPVAPPGSSRVRTARIIAVVADAVQLAVFPLFGGGVLSPINNALDVIVGLLMVRLVGWHFAFLPTFVAELVPGLDLFPSWSAAVWFVTRGRDEAPR